MAARLAVLQSLTAALARTRTPEAVADVIIHQGLAKLDAEIGVVALLSEDGRTLRNIGFQGVSAEVEAAWREYPIESPVPLAEVALRRAEVLVRTREERNRRYPVLADVHGPCHGGAVAAFPLEADGHMRGVLAFCFATDRTLDEDELSFFRALADQCGQALERARLYALAEHEIAVRRRSEEKLEQAQERLRLALEAAHLVAWDWELATGHATCTDAGLELFGFEHGSGEDFQRVIEPEDFPYVQERFRRALAPGAQEPYSAEYRIRTPDGRQRWVSSVGAVLRAPDGRALRITGVSADITERKHAEATLRDESRRKDELLAMLAHELRNPLAPIRTAASALGRIDTGGDAGRQLGRLAEVIDRQSGHMSRMVDDLLDVSRLTQGRLHLQSSRLDWNQLVRTVVQDHRDAFERAGLLLQVELAREPLWVRGDTTRLSQVLANLLHNAQKFTDAGGRVALTTALDEAHGDAVLRVHDTGIGMDASMQARAFDRLAQAEGSLDRSRGGLGLGLALVKGLTELHGGTVTVASAGIGHGTTFELRLPLDRSRPSETRPPAKRAAPRRRVLLIEDNEDAAQMLQVLLELLGHESTIAEDGRAGIEHARRGDFDLVLSDIGLPGGLDGYAVARALRAEPALRSTYLVALSGYGRSEDKARALDAGFDAHLTKPVSTEALESLLASLPTSDAAE